tara:strand:- start:541 stop:1248 length:708 start_codon:yes stop_codon:yes gene_type:complete
MALPKLNVPRYALTLPSNGAKVKYRPFLVKEEKMLLLAMESEDQSMMVETITNLIESCTNLTKVKELATFDIEFLFLQIRSKSVGETVDVMMTCPDDNETQVKVTVPLEDVKVKIDPKHKKELKINQEVGLVMKYPSMDMFVKNNFSDQPDVENVFELAIDCIDQIFEGEEVYEAKESSRGELMDFLETMNSAQFKQIQEFFETMPKMSYDVKFTNPKTKKKHSVTLEGLASFFG